MKNPKAISASRWAVFKECQLKYYATYDLGMKSEVHPSAKMGSAFHAMMERAVKDGVIPSEEFAKECCIKFGIPPGMLGEAVDEVITLAEKTIKNGYLDGITNCIGTEYGFNEKLCDGSTVINGFIDRLDKTDGRYLIIDLKTSKVPYTEAELEDNVQAKVYDLAVHKIFKDAESIDIIFWFVKTQTRLIKSFDPSAFEKHEKELIITRHQIVSIKDPKPTPNRFCEYCPYVSQCPAMGKSAKSSFGDIAKSF